MPADRSSVPLLEHTSEKACVKETGYLCTLGNLASPRRMPRSVHLFPKEVEARLAHGYREDNGGIEQRDAGYYHASDQEQGHQAWVDPAPKGI